MKSTLPLIGGLVVVVGIGLAYTAGAGPQQQRTQQAAPKPETKPAAPAAPPAAAAEPSIPAEAKPLVDLLSAFVKAYNVPDAAGLAAMFVDDGAVIDSAGEATRGKADITTMYASAFEATPGLKLDGGLDSYRFLTPDVAQVEGQSRLSGGGAGDALTITRYSMLVVRRNNAWKIAELRDYPVAAEDITPYERLRELEWMVGDWVDESENSRVSSSIKWADNQSYLVRTYSVEIQGEKQMTGTMFIGWDPQNSQIKSWVFDSQGGHGEGLWTRAAENQWIVKAHGVMRDGRPSSATQIHTILNKDSVKTVSIDRIIGGEIAPDVPEIVMVRKPPQPSASPAGSGSGK